MRGSSVMVVEDEGIVAKDIQRRLERFGYSVHALASSAGEAIRMAESSRPDLVLMDIVLKGSGDGIDAAEQIRARFDIPVVFLSAYADEKTVHRARGSEPFGYLLKPFNEVELRTTIEVALFKHRVERKLKQSEGWLGAILASVGDAVIATDAGGKVRFMNPVAEQMTGWRQAEAFDRSLQDVCIMRDDAGGPDINDLVTQVMQKRTAVSHPHPVFLVSRHGSELCIMENAAPILGDEGTLTGVVLVFQDMSERKKSEDALLKSEERYRFLVENAPDAIFSLSHQAIILDLNLAFEVLTGWKREGWIGRSFTDLVHPEDLTLAQQLFSRPSMGERSTTGELRIRKQTGEYMIWEFTTTSRIEQGLPVALLGIARDITERKRFEEQVRQSQKMDSIGLLAGGVAHDFNNLLSVIVGHVALLERFGSEEKRRIDSLARIQRASERGAALVRQLLTIPRRTEAVLKPTSVNDIVKEIVVLTTETFPRTITISCSLGPDLPAIIADANQIHQVLLNLCVNARDAMPHGGVLSIGTFTVARDKLVNPIPDSDASSFLVLRVADTGEGMDEKTQHRIFEPFFTTKGPGKGMGLGLAVAYGIVKNHAGFIHVESMAGKGTVFSVHFPVPEVSRSEPAPGRQHPTGTTKGTETVLLVEDEEALLELVRDALASKGYRVLTADNGEEAVRMFAQFSADIRVVFSDVGLPRLGGEEMLEKMQEIDPDVRVVFASGYVDDDMKMRLLKRGAADLLPKPHNPETVCAKIREVLDRQKA